MDDVTFLQDLFKRFVPGGGGKARNPKHPVVKGWLDVTPEQSAELARHAKYQKGPFIFLNGKDHGINDGRSRPKGSWETRPHVQKGRRRVLG